jgi:hypothetical protein
MGGVDEVEEEREQEDETECLEIVSGCSAELGSIGGRRPQ